jgi:quercetin dioxygenase-like cupin family protein
MRPKKLTLRAGWILPWLLCAAVAAFAAQDEGGFVRTTPDEIQWHSNPNVPGLQNAVLVGDPAKPGLYIVRVKFSPGVMTRPHFHPDDRYVVVLKGTWYAGTGDEFAPDKAMPMKPGSFMKHPALAHHFDGSKDEEVIVQITGIGPTATTLIHPADGPDGHWH